MYEFGDVIAECLTFLKNEVSEFKKRRDGGDDEDLDTEKENSKQRAFTIIGKRPGTNLFESYFQGNN